jgi:glutamate 5-kinase
MTTEIEGAIKGESYGTAFLPAKKAAKGKKKWILAVPISGEVAVDAAGAKAVLRGMSLGMNNVLRCTGEFRVQECVRAGAYTRPPLRST